tara:strand:- start:95 stop:1069 length:975 start_codon:yes stop_codon:yes gene_type:complete
MKKLLLLLIIPLLSFGQQLTYIPDNAFEMYLENNGYGNGINNDNYVFTDAIDTLTNLAISNVGDLTGIEDFQNLSTLELFFPSTIYIDLSSVLNLTFLRICNSSSLESLNLQNGFNYNLSYFSLYGNINLNCIQVDDADWSITNWIIYDPWNYFDEDCGYIVMGDCFDDNEVMMEMGGNSEIFYPYWLPAGLSCEESFLAMAGYGVDFCEVFSDICECTCSDQVVGCVNMNACNYNPNAVIDNGSCLFPGDECPLLIDLNNEVLEYGVLNENCVCLGISSIEEELIDKSPITTIDILGREITNNKGFQLHIYDDGSVEKKYVIE